MSKIKLLSVNKHFYHPNFYLSKFYFHSSPSSIECAVEIIEYLGIDK